MELLPLLTALLLISAGANMSASAVEWRRFRGLAGQGVSSAKGLPTAWSFDQNILWKTPLPSPGGSSPVMLGDRVSVTCCSGYTVHRFATEAWRGPL